VIKEKNAKTGGHQKYLSAREINGELTAVIANLSSPQIESITAC
jgi:hypothetical protein